MNTNRQKLIVAFTILKALETLMTGWIFAIYVFYVLSKGYSLFDVTLLNVIFMSTDFLLNPFTGLMGDRFGHKKVYCAGILFFALGMTTYGFGSTFLVFALGEFFSGMGKALMSDALESWLTNEIGRENEKEIKTIKARAKTLGYLVDAPIALVGSLAFSFVNPRAPWFLGGFGSVVLFLCAFILLRKLKEYKHEESHLPENLVTVPNTIKIMRESSAWKFSILVSFVVSFAVQPFNMFWTKILEGYSNEIWLFGLMRIGLTISMVLGLYISTVITSSRKNISLTLVSIGTPILILTFIPGSFMFVVWFLTHEIGRGVIDEIVYTYSNKDHEDKSRNTANSIRGAASTFGAASGLLISGSLTNFLEPLQVWLLFSCMITFVGSIFLKGKKD